MMVHKILHQQLCGEELEQQLARIETTEQTGPRRLFVRIQEDAQGLAEPLVTKISQTSLLHRAAEERSLLETYAPRYRRECPIHGPHGPWKPERSEIIKMVNRHHAHTLRQSSA